MRRFCDPYRILTTEPLLGNHVSWIMVTLSARESERTVYFLRIRVARLHERWIGRKGSNASHVQTPGPNIIGATGGSGTRVVARIARSAGMFIGTNLNISEDALDVAAFDDHWIGQRVSQERSHPSHPAPPEMLADFRTMLARHCGPREDETQPWGWKHPPSIYLLRFYHQQFPQLRFLHVIRDGRDMAYSSNQNQLRKFGSTILDPDYGEKHLSGRYMLVRFEDLCAQSVPTVARILIFFGLQGDAEAIVRCEVSPPESIGRWRNQDEAALAELHQVGGAGLRRFGYWAR